MQATLAIVGAGRVGRALGRRLREQGWKIGAVVTRSEASARRAVRSIGAGHGHGGMTRQLLASRVILISTPDDAIAGVAQELARIGAEELRRKVALHTSGTLAMNVLEAVRVHGAAAGSLHPLQAFSGVGVPPLEGRLFVIEGDAAAVRVARQMVRTLGGSAVRIDGEKKPLLHAAAALAAGHVLTIEEAATQMLMSLGMKRREAMRALLPLTRQVLENFERLGSRAAWTGPLARRDYRAVAAHHAAMRDLPSEFLEGYGALSRLAARVLAQDSAVLLAELEQISWNRKAKSKSTGG
jgi:predicted short-subunit dehydrogenase-like oxidoreductase (DUF2520 family)